jgi:hypothetical protein
MRGPRCYQLEHVLLAALGGSNTVCGKIISLQRKPTFAGFHRVLVRKGLSGVWERITGSSR